MKITSMRQYCVYLTMFINFEYAIFVNLKQMIFNKNVIRINEVYSSLIFKALKYVYVFIKIRIFVCLFLNNIL